MRKVRSAFDVAAARHGHTGRTVLRRVEEARPC